MVTAHDCDSLGPGPGSRLLRRIVTLLLAINNNNSNTYYLLLHDSSQYTGPGGWREDGLDRYEGPQSSIQNGEHITSGHQQGDNLSQSE